MPKRLQQAFLSLGEQTSLPSAKQRVRGTAESNAWGKFLAAFSPVFAESAIKALGLGPGDLLFDPFVGSGTTVVAAAKLGVAAVGNDLDPVSAVISRARIASSANPKKVHELLRGISVRQQLPFAADAYEYFGPDDLSFASSVLAKLKQNIPNAGESPLQTLLSDETREFDSHAVALAALLNASWASARVVRGSNPVWHRKAIPGERLRTESLAAAASDVANCMLQSLKHGDVASDRNVRILCGDARKMLLSPKSVDAVLTSPPYLNRLDYVVNHLPELLILSGIHSVDIGTLKASMTGTTKILPKAEADEQVGSTCAALLERVKRHPSYASETYYHPIFVQYFNDMLIVFRQLKRQCRRGASGIMVIQTSYYKDIAIDSAQIFSEMAKNVGFRLQPITSEEVSVHYGNLSPRQLKYVPKKRLHEWLLEMAF